MLAFGVLLRAALARFLAWLLRGLNAILGNRLATWVAQVLGWLGLQVAFGTFAFGPLIAQIRGYAEGIETAGGGGELTAAALNWLGFLNFDKALTMILSAYVMAFAATSARAFLRRR